MPRDTSLITTIVMELVLAFIGGLAASKLTEAGASLGYCSSPAAFSAFSMTA